MHNGVSRAVLIAIAAAVVLMAVACDGKLIHVVTPQELQVQEPVQEQEQEKRQFVVDAADAKGDDNVAVPTARKHMIVPYIPRCFAAADAALGNPADFCEQHQAGATWAQCGCVVRDGPVVWSTLDDGNGPESEPAGLALSGAIRQCVASVATRALDATKIQQAEATAAVAGGSPAFVLVDCAAGTARGIRVAGLGDKKVSARGDENNVQSLAQEHDISVTYEQEGNKLRVVARTWPTGDAGARRGLVRLDVSALRCGSYKCRLESAKVPSSADVARCAAAVSAALASDESVVDTKQSVRDVCTGTHEWTVSVTCGGTHKQCKRMASDASSKPRVQTAVAATIVLHDINDQEIAQPFVSDIQIDAMSIFSPAPATEPTTVPVPDTSTVATAAADEPKTKPVDVNGDGGVRPVQGAKPETWIQIEWDEKEPGRVCVSPKAADTPIRGVSVIATNKKGKEVKADIVAGGRCLRDASQHIKCRVERIKSNNGDHDRICFILPAVARKSLVQPQIVVTYERQSVVGDEVLVRGGRTFGHNGFLHHEFHNLDTHQIGGLYMWEAGLVLFAVLFLVIIVIAIIIAVCAPTSSKRTTETRVAAASGRSGKRARRARPITGIRIITPMSEPETEPAFGQQSDARRFLAGHQAATAPGSPMLYQSIAPSAFYSPPGIMQMHYSRTAAPPN